MNTGQVAGCCLQAASQASPVPGPPPRRRKASKRARPAYELSETTAEHSSEGASDADGFFENLCSGAEPLVSIGGRTSSTGSQDQAAASRQISLRPTQLADEVCPSQTAEEPGHQKPQDTDPPSTGPTQPWTFVQCDIKACQKWRRIITLDVPEGPWTCAMNHDPECAGYLLLQSFAWLSAGNFGLSSHAPTHRNAPADAQQC